MIYYIKIGDLYFRDMDNNQNDCIRMLLVGKREYAIHANIRDIAEEIAYNIERNTNIHCTIEPYNDDNVIHLEDYFGKASKETDKGI